MILIPLIFIAVALNVLLRAMIPRIPVLERNWVRWTIVLFTMATSAQYLGSL